MTGTWTHKFVAKKDYAYLGYARSAKITVTAGLHHIKGNALPHFSVTCDIMEGTKDVAGGSMHDEILQCWPELVPVVALHLSDSHGVPMYAEQNGWYYLAGYYGGAGEMYHLGNATPRRSPDECLAVFAKHVRVDVEAARILADGWRRDTPDLVSRGGRALMAAWMKASEVRWQREADVACVLLDSLAAKEAI